MNRLTIIVAIAIPATLGTAWSSAADDRAAHRAFLEWEVGTWDAVITMTDPASGQAQTFRGVQTDRLGACGLWLITDLTLVPGPDGAEAPPYEGHGVLGYDPDEKKLVGLWVDSKTDWLATASGSVSSDGTTLTLAVDARHPITRARYVQQYVTSKIDAETRRLEIFVPTPDGDRMLVARIDSKRRAPRAAEKD